MLYVKPQAPEEGKHHILLQIRCANHDIHQTPLASDIEKHAISIKDKLVPGF
jgi:hypothetical protein